MPARGGGKFPVKGKGNGASHRKGRQEKDVNVSVKERRKGLENRVD